MRYLLVFVLLVGVVMAEEKPSISEREYDLAVEKAKQDYEQKIKPFKDELDKKLQVEKAKLIVKLEVELEAHTKAGNLDTAIKLRDKIKALRADTKDTKEIQLQNRYVGKYSVKNIKWTKDDSAREMNLNQDGTFGFTNKPTEVEGKWEITEKGDLKLSWTKWPADVLRVQLDGSFDDKKGFSMRKN